MRNNSQYSASSVPHSSPNSQLRAEVLGVGGDGDQGLSGGFEQQISVIGNF